MKLLPEAPNLSSKEAWMITVDGSKIKYIIKLHLSMKIKITIMTIWIMLR